MLRRLRFVFDTPRGQQNSIQHGPGWILCRVTRQRLLPPFPYLPFRRIVSVMLPPSLALSLFIFASFTLVIGASTAIDQYRTRAHAETPR